MEIIYNYREYREFIRAWIKHNPGRHGLLGRIAEHIGSQSSHVSRVLAEQVHLTPDQAFLLAGFMNLSESEQNYFEILVECERSGNPLRRQKLNQRLQEIRAEQANLAKRFSSDTQPLTAEIELFYYSAWYWAAIHIATDIPAYRSPANLAKRLSLPEPFVRECLGKLRTYGFVELKDGDQWTITSRFHHLAKTSPLTAIRHWQWRNRSVDDHSKAQDDGLRYTMVQAISEKDFTELKTFLLGAIDRYRAIADRSPSEELICFCCDFFRV